MKGICRLWGKGLITGLLLIAAAAPAPVFGRQYDGEQIILSWTGDSAHSQTVTWHSKGKKEGYLRYREQGRGLAAEKQVKAQITQVGEADYYRYRADVKGLSSRKVYQYRIGDGTSWSRTRTFTTAPPSLSAEKSPPLPNPATSFEFLYLGDVQYRRRSRDYPAWGKMLREAKRRHPDAAFALTGGDMVNSPRKLKDWQLFLRQASPVFSRIPMMTAIGNHETSVKADFYLQMLALPQNGPKGLEGEFYSFDYGSCHITVLNTSFFLENRKAAEGAGWQEQREAIGRWLAGDLKSCGAKWRIIAMHHPAYGLSDEDPIYKEIRREWEPLFEQGGVDLVFCGHQHIYMRTREIGGVTYIMGNSGKRRSARYNGENAPGYSEALNAAGANYQIVAVSGSRLSLTSCDEAGRPIDKWTKERERGRTWKAAAAGAGIMSATGTAALLALRKRKNRR